MKTSSAESGFMRMNERLRKRLLSRQKSGISEVVGAMLLMIVVVVAVGTFAYYLNALQTQNAQRTALLNSVANEKLQITNLLLFPNDPLTQFQFGYSYHNPINLTFSPFPTIFYVHYVDASHVTIYNGTDFYYQDTGGVWRFQSIPFAGVSVALTQPAVPEPAYYNFIGSGVMANFAPLFDLLTGKLLTTGSTIQFELGLANNTQFSLATWDSMNMTVRNLNIENSGLRDIEVNNIPVLHWLEISGGLSVIQNVTGQELIPARGSVFLNVNLSNFALTKDTPLTLTLLSSVGNFFDTPFTPTQSEFTATTSEENFGTSTRDVINLQVSSSFANNSQVAYYLWRIDMPNLTNPSFNNWNNPSQVWTSFLSGPSIQIRPESFLNSTKLQNAGVTGPYRITLTTVNLDGQSINTTSLIIPNDPNIAPNTLSASASGGIITATIDNIFGTPQYGVPVFFTPITGGVTVAPSFGTTSTTGTITTTCTGTGIVQVNTGNVLPIQVAC